MKELMELIEDATNVKAVSYSKETNLWTVEFFNGDPNEMEPETLLDFLKHA